jgi:peptide/nickel transport system substrate-binding protein
MQKIVPSCAAFMACAIWLAGPAYAAPSDPVPKSGGTITWGVATEPSCFDPHRSSQQAAFFVARNYIDSLVAKRADGSFAPWLATQWSIAPDGLTYTFTLRDGVTFHDGTPLNAEAVKANFDFVKKPEYAANAAALLDRYARAEVAAPNVVRLILARPDSSFLESVSNV